MWGAVWRLQAARFVNWVILRARTALAGPLHNDAGRNDARKRGPKEGVTECASKTSQHFVAKALSIFPKHADLTHYYTKVSPHPKAGGDVMPLREYVYRI